MKSTRNLFLAFLFSAVAFGLNAQLPGITIYDNATLGPNLIENGSFENSTVGSQYCGFNCTPGWCHFGGCNNQFVEDESALICNFGGFTPVPGPIPFDGEKSLKMFGDFGNGGFSVTGSFTGTPDPNVSIQGGTAYQASCYMWSPSQAYCPGDHIGTTSNRAVINLEWKDAGGNIIDFITSDINDPFQGADANGEWHEVNVAGIAPSNATQATVTLLFLQPSQEGGAVWFDAVSLNEVRFPTAPTLGEWGILNLGLILLIIGIVAIRQTSIVRARTAA